MALIPILPYSIHSAFFLFLICNFSDSEKPGSYYLQYIYLFINYCIKTKSEFLDFYLVYFFSVKTLFLKATLVSSFPLSFHPLLFGFVIYLLYSVG